MAGAKSSYSDGRSRNDVGLTNANKADNYCARPLQDAAHCIEIKPTSHATNVNVRNAMYVHLWTKVKSSQGHGSHKKKGRALGSAYAEYDTSRANVGQLHARRRPLTHLQS